MNENTRYFQGTFKLVSIIAQFFCLRRQTVEHSDPSNLFPSDILTD